MIADMHWLQWVAILGGPAFLLWFVWAGAQRLETKLNKQSAELWMNGRGFLDDYEYSPHARWFMRVGVAICFVVALL